MAISLPSILPDIMARLTEMMTTDAPLFAASGIKIFDSFAVITVVWFGVKWALAGGMSMERFAAFVMKLSFGFAMMHFYINPLPFAGVTFPHLVIDQGTYLAGILNQNMASDVMAHISKLYLGMETPGLSLAINLLEGLRWLVTVACLIVALATVFAVIAWGYIAVAVMVMVGPMMIPFFLIEELDWLFWGWLKALLQYSFYPVIANAFVLVLGKLLVNFVDTAGAPPYDGAKILVLFVPLTALLITFAYGVLKVPSLVSDMFAGRSGNSVIPKAFL